ncbi:MAG: hypothetical protein HQ568_00355, partial [Calditrichaeota bacterium]|nr:hypothetical protein [Calditrichota bacterium]
MLDLRNYYRNENEKVRESYDSTLLRINEICDETADYQKLTEKREYYRFLNTTGNLILKLAELESNLCDEYFVTKFFEELYEENKALFSELLPANYVESYLNPTYCVKIFGDKYGQALSFIYVIYRQYINYAFFHKIFRMEETNRLFMNLFDVVKGEDFSYKALLEIINRNCKRDRTIEMTYDLKESFDKSFTYYNDIIEDSDINDLRYIFKYGRVITDYEIRTAKHLGNLPQDEINRLSTLTAKAYVDGFIRDEKDISIKSTVGVGFSIGQERIIRKLIENLKGYNLEAVVNSVSTTVVNKQYSYDHRFDTTMCLDEEFTSMMERCFGSAFEDCKEMASAFSGIIGFDKFGEPPFIPENKPECLKFTDEQQKIIQIFQNKMMMIQERYMPRKEWSFTMIALPSPEIG